ncbi:MAG: hypothetical protein WCL53_03660 [Chloroflexota bacterium]
MDPPVRGIPVWMPDFEDHPSALADEGTEHQREVNARWGDDERRDD